MSPISRRTRWAFAAGALLWAAGVLVVVPAVIRQAYAGESLELLNRAIVGQGEHPVETYLRRWQALALTGTVLAILGSATIALLVQRRAALARWIKSRIETPPLASPGQTIAIGTCLGWASGLADALGALVPLAITGDPLDSADPRRLWMAPLAGALAGAVAGVLLGALVRGRGGVAQRVPVVLFGTAAFSSVVLAFRLHLHPAASLLLALGASVALAGWLDQRQSGSTPAFRRAAPWLIGAVGVVALIMGGRDWLAARRADARAAGAQAGAPSVLILLLDTVRAESMSLYGYDRATTPALTRWGASGVVFEQAIVPAPWTLPTHASLFTGLPPHQLSADFRTPLDDAAPTLSEVLGGRGYRTAAFVANLTYATRVAGLDRGFAVYQDHPLTLGAFVGSARWSARPVRWIRRLFGNRRLLVRKTAAMVNAQFLDWLPEDGRPYLAFLNYFDAHTPYETHAPFDTLFVPTPPRYWLFPAWTGITDSASLAENTAAYDAAIAYVDHHVGRLLDTLEARGNLANTVVIVVGDHGEHLGEHGVFTHANSLYLPLLRVPLVVRFPGEVPAGLRVTEPVAVQDVAATILALIGPETAGLLPGRSLRETWEALDSLRPDPGRHASAGVLSQLSPNDFAVRTDPIRRGAMVSLVRGNLHYIRNGDGIEELFNWASDPDELFDLAPLPAGDSLLPGLRRMVDSLRGSPR